MTDARGRSPKKKKVTREQWLVLALKTLADKGIDAVKIDVLARNLGVAKTSFYWHFENRNQLLEEMLQFWEHEYTEVAFTDPDLLAMPARERLLGLAELIVQYQLNCYEQAVSAWAQGDQRAAEAMARVVQRRLKFVGGMFRELGFRGEELEMRTKLYVCFHALEPTIYDMQDTARERRIRKKRIRLLSQQLLDD